MTSCLLKWLLLGLWMLTFILLSSTEINVHWMNAEMNSLCINEYWNECLLVSEYWNEVCLKMNTEMSAV